MQGYIYIVRSVYQLNPPLNGWFKVGRTSNPDKRLTLYNSQFPVDIWYMYYISPLLENMIEVEEAVLERIRQIKGIKQKRREWFKNTRSGRAGLSYTLPALIEEILSNHSFTVNK